jgi:lysozyme
MKTSQKGIDLIKHFEGTFLTAYYCPAGVLTIGTGHTGVDVYVGMTITEKEAEDLLKEDLKKFESCVSKLVKVPLSQGQFDALVSFTFNLGCGSLEESTLLRKLNSGDYEGTSKEFDRWVNAGGKKLEGLVRRRNAEEELFRSGNTGNTVKKSIIALQNTILKKEPIPSEKLKDVEKVSVSTGKTYTIVWQGNVVDNHVKVSLDNDAGNWYVFVPHWSGLGLNDNTSSSKILNVPYYSQRDNKPNGNDLDYRTCFSSSCAMLAKYLKPSSITGDDDYISKRQKFGDTTDAAAHVKCLNSLGIPAKFIQNGNLDTLRNQINKGIPVPIGVLHKGSSSAPSGGGHWIIVIGYDDKGFFVNDPWGDLDNASGTYVSTNGKQIHWSNRMMDQRWTVSGTSDGWAIIA